MKIKPSHLLQKIRRMKFEEVKKAKWYYGFFALMTNQAMGAIEALEIYRQKDVVEKALGNLKERLNMRRTLVSSEQSLDGKLFMEFVALIYLSYIKKKMQETGLFRACPICPYFLKAAKYSIFICGTFSKNPSGFYSTT